MSGLSRSGKIAAMFFVAVVFLFAVKPLGESDAFYHLKAGEVIWETRSIPQEDIFSYTAEGRKWVPHEWLAQVVFHLIYLGGGLWGVILFTAGIAALTYGLIFLILFRRGADPWLILLTLPAAVWLAGPYWQPRPQIFSYLFLTLLFLFLGREGRLSRLAVWALIFVWANMHGGVVLGIAIAFLHTLLRAYEARGERARLAGFAAGALGAALINPAGYEVLIYTAYVYPALQTLSIYEWRSLFVHLGGVRENISLLGITASAALALRTALRREKIFFAGTGLVFALLPLVSIRHIGLLASAGMIPLISLFGSGALLRRYVRPGSLAVPAIALLAAAGIFALPSESVHAGRLPVHASAFMETMDIAGPRFNLYNEGGYLIWRFWPEYKVFVDGRSEVFAGRPLSELVAIVTAHPEWNRLVDEKYRINHFLLAYRPAALARSVRPLVDKLFAEGWVLVYWDDAAVIFVRDAPENAELIAEYGLRHISPFRDPRTIGAEEGVSAAGELERLLELAPHAETIREYTAEFLSRDN